MRSFPLCILGIFLLTILPGASAAPVCAGTTVCAGEATQACGGPSAYGDGWDGFTGVWGQAQGVEYGAGGWDRCYPGDWATGAFVNVDAWPAGGYQTLQARFDYAPDAARDCYLSGGLYGWRSQYVTFLCPDSEDDLPIPNPGWGSVL